MCNLYSITKGRAAIIESRRAFRDMTGYLPPMPGVFPDYSAPIVRSAPDCVRELSLARWGMPSSQFAQMEATKKRAVKLEAKGKAVDFKQLLRDDERRVRLSDNRSEQGGLRRLSQGHAGDPAYGRRN